MNWARAIKINQNALSRIVAELIAMVGLQVDGVLGRLSRPTYRTVMAILRPAEAAVRRLIVIMARGIVVKPSPSRPMPKNLKIKAKTTGQRRMAFRLCDPPQRFRPWWTKCRRPKPRLPRVWFPSDDEPPPNVISYRPEDFGKPEPPPKDGKVDGSRLGRRLLAIKQALDDLPAQAKRLARWRMRQQAKAKAASPLRPGRPPGHRHKETHEVDAVLKKCHALARDVEPDDTS